MTVKKTKQTLSTTLEKTEQSLNSLETALDNNVGAHPVRDTGDGESGLPKGWYEIKISEVAEVVAGGTPKAGDSSNFAAPGSAIAWLTPADLSKYKSTYISYGKRDLSQSGYDSSSAKLLPKGSLLFSSRAPIGYVAIASNEISTNQGFKNFVFPYGVDSLFAYYYLNSIRSFAESLGTGTTFKEISGSTAKTLPFILPPLAEQTVIAQTLDALLAQVDNIKTRLDAIPKILKTFRQSVLAAAVSGKLTEAWRGENSDSLLSDNKYKDMLCELNRRRSESEKKRIIKAKSADWFYDRSKSIPEGWVQSNLIEITKLITCGVAKKPDYTEDGVPFLSAQNSKPFSPNLNKIKYIKEDDFRTFTVGGKPEKDDVLYSRVGANFGEACVIPWDFDFAIYVSLTLIKPVHEILNSQYLTLFLNSIDGVLQSRGGILVVAH